MKYPKINSIDLFLEFLDISTYHWNIYIYVFMYSCREILAKNPILLDGDLLFVFVWFCLACLIRVLDSRCSCPKKATMKWYISRTHPRKHGSSARNIVIATLSLTSGSVQLRWWRFQFTAQKYTEMHLGKLQQLAAFLLAYCGHSSTPEH